RRGTNLISRRRLSRLEKRMASDQRKSRFSDASPNCFVLGIESPNSGAPEYVRYGLREARGGGRIYPTGLTGAGLRRAPARVPCRGREGGVLLLSRVDSAYFTRVVAQHRYSRLDG